MTAALPIGAVLALLEAAVNRLLALDPETLDRLAALDGRVIAIEPSNCPALAVVPRRHGLQLLYPAPDAVDARVRGRLAELLQAQVDGGARGLDIGGDKQLASAFSAALRDARVDWAELLAPCLGDVPAERGAQTAQSVVKALRAGARSVLQGGAEFLQYEQPVLVSANEWESFRAQVRELHEAIGALERRIALLALRLQ